MRAVTRGYARSYGLQCIRGVGYDFCCCKLQICLLLLAGNWRVYRIRIVFFGGCVGWRKTQRLGADYCSLDRSQQAIGEVRYLRIGCGLPLSLC